MSRLPKLCLAPAAAFILAGTAAIKAQVVKDPSELKDVHGTWTGEFHAAKMFIQLRASSPDGGDWSNGQTVPTDEFSGLPVTDEQFTASNLKFELRREAGNIAFEGAFRDGRGAGLFVFTPRAAFTAEMKAIGYSDDLPLWRRYQLAFHDVGPKYIKALGAEGYTKLSLDAVQRARTHGVTIDYIKSLKGEGYSNIAFDELVRIRDHGVTPAYIEGLKNLGFTSAPIDQLVRARDHGVTPDFIRELRDQNISVQTLDEFVRLRDHGVKPAFVRELAAQGYKNLPADQLVRLRDHGVTAEYLADMKELGIKDLTLDQVVRLRDHGITPGFVNHVRARGFKDASADELIRLKNGGLWKL